MWLPCLDTTPIVPVYQSLWRYRAYMGTNCSGVEKGENNYIFSSSCYMNLRTSSDINNVLKDNENRKRSAVNCSKSGDIW